MVRHIRTGMLAAVAAAALVTVPPEPAATRHAASKRYGARAQERQRRGRPRKFSRPSRAVTLTLPEDVIATLQAIDRDLSHAVARVTEAIAPPRPRAMAELTACGDRTVIVVPCNPLLTARTGVDLVPLADGGALISFDHRMTVPELELRVVDALADPAIEGADRQMFETLAEILRQARLGAGISLREHRILVVEHSAPQRARRRTTPASRGRARASVA